MNLYFLFSNFLWEPANIIRILWRSNQGKAQCGHRNCAHEDLTVCRQRSCRNVTCPQHPGEMSPARVGAWPMWADAIMERTSRKPFGAVTTQWRNWPSSPMWPGVQRPVLQSLPRGFLWAAVCSGQARCVRILILGAAVYRWQTGFRGQISQLLLLLVGPFGGVLWDWAPAACRRNLLSVPALSSSLPSLYHFPHCLLVLITGIPSHTRPCYKSLLSRAASLVPIPRRLE